MFYEIPQKTLADGGVGAAGSMSLPYTEQKKETRNGTEKSVTKPWKMLRMAKRSPEVRVMTGRVVSIVVAPPDVMGASGPKRRSSSGARSSVAISRRMLDMRATVPSSAPTDSVMKMEESE